MKDWPKTGQSFYILKKGECNTIHRISIEFEKLNGNKIILPKNFSYILQSFVYDLGRDKDLHDRFYECDSKYYHLFVYSPIIGNHTYKNEKHIFEGPVRIIFSSPVSDFCMSIAQRVLNTSHYHLGSNEIRTKSIMPLNEPEFEEEMYLQAVSPITVHKTIDVDSKKKTIYFKPFEKEFGELIKTNLTRKYKAFTGKSVENLPISIIPDVITDRDRRVLLYEKDKKNPFVIKGWTGTYKIQGSSELIKFAYRSGIGARNSQGFGFVDIAKKNMS